MTEIASQPKTFYIRREGAPEAGLMARDRLAEEVAAEFGPRAEKPFALAAHDATGGWIGAAGGSCRAAAG